MSSPKITTIFGFVACASNLVAKSKKAHTIERKTPSGIRMDAISILLEHYFFQGRSEQNENAIGPESGRPEEPLRGSSASPILYGIEIIA